MKNDILTHLDNPGALEKLYRANKVPFRREFSTLYPELKGNMLADFWNERLQYENDESNWGTGRQLVIILLAALVAGLIAKIPFYFDLNKEFFYARNIGFIIFPVLSIYFSWKNKLSLGKLIFCLSLMLGGLFFINFLPVNDTSDTLVLSCIHLVLFLWAITGFIFVGGWHKNTSKRLSYLTYNGDLVVMTALILLAGGIMTGLTINLFQLIGFDIEAVYFEHVGIFGVAAAPILGTHLTQTNPQLVGRVSPVIAKLFSPIVLVMLVIYLIAIIYSGKDPYNDRDFLLLFNALLVGVMAIIFFSIAETSKSSTSRPELWVIFLLAAVTILLNGIALSAILFRISTWGITPNRAAVLGGNVLILINLLLVTAQVYSVLTKKKPLKAVGDTIAGYLPVYVLWVVVVTFVFPLLFGFR